MDKQFWSDKLPDGLPLDLPEFSYKSILDVFEKSVKKFGQKPAFSNMDYTISYNQLDEMSKHFANYLRNHTSLEAGDRIAVQLPNLIQFPIVVFGAMRAGLVVVNTNPLYTEREMEHQFNDSQAKALVVLSSFADKVEKILPKTALRHVIVTDVGDALPTMKRFLVNSVVKYVKKMTPDYHLPNAVAYSAALKMGARHQFTGNHSAQADDVAVLQYTGGTTGVAKGAMLTHSNIVSNMMQVRCLVDLHFDEGQETIVAPLPLYHIFAFTIGILCMMELGSCTILITNPRDIPGFIKTLKTNRFSAFMGLNTLFVAMMNHPEFKDIDFSKLKFTISGGMALQGPVADRWEDMTGCKICEGYGLTETSPCVTVNPPDRIQIGSIGIPLPGTELDVRGPEGESLGIGESGELCVRGPQVMKGYWQREDATAEVMTQDNFFKTGDVAVIQEDGYLKIVDRIKDMILVSGFNVYPNEIEDVVVSHPGIVETAAVGMPDEKSGEVVKLFVVKSDPTLTEEDVRNFCKEHLTAYKVPKMVVFKDELPKTNLGKILRRELRT